MKAIGIILAIGVLVVIVGGIGYGAYSGVEFLSVQWGSLSNDWKAILIVLGAILIACSLYLSWTIQGAMKRYALKGAGKVQVYNAFVDWYAVLKEGEGAVVDVTAFREIRNRMMLWGGKPVSKQANILYEVMDGDSVDAAEVLKKADGLYLVIRRELGNGESVSERDIQ